MERGKNHGQVSSKNYVREPFKATKIWNDLVAHLRTNLESKRHRWKMQIYENCFKGSEVIEILHHYIRNHPDLANNASRNQVKSFCQCLIDSKVFECAIVSDPSNRRESSIFEGGSKLYRFVSHRKSEIDFKPNNVREKTALRDSNDVWVRAETVKRRAAEIKKETCKLEAKENVGANWKRPSCSRKRRSVGVVYHSALSYASSPWKKKRKSLDSDFKMKQTNDCRQQDSFGGEKNDAYFQIALGYLLRLLEVPFLEEILSPSIMESSQLQKCFVISNVTDSQSEMGCSLPYSSISNKGLMQDIGGESDWFNVAVSCLKARNEFPLPCKEEIGYQNVSNLSKAGICESLTEYYASLLDSLIPSNFGAIVEDIMILWRAGRKLKVLAALKLLIVLIPFHCHKHLQKLLCFIKKTMTCSTKATVAGNTVQMRFITRKFIGAVLPKSVQDKTAAEQLINFMVSKQNQIFKVPESVKMLASKQGTGVGEPAIPSVCQQISKVEYEQQTKHVTYGALVKLMKLVTDDVQLSLKEKQQKINLFEKYHPSVFLTQPPLGKS